EEYRLVETKEEQLREEMFVPFRAIKNDIKGRLMCYKQDWAGGFRAGFSTTSIHLQSQSFHLVNWREIQMEFLQQSKHWHQHQFVGSHNHTIIGGQSFFILGVAEPTVIMFNFAKERPELGRNLFLAWTGWVCMWTALLLFLLAIFGACSIINRFTRVAGELFGLLIATLFMQQAIKVRSWQYRTGKNLIVALRFFEENWKTGFSIVASMLEIQISTTEPWQSLIADHGVPLMVLILTAVSYIPSGSVPNGIL
ncbi:Bicarbonate transporter-like, transmembrane domain, partial [Dillenia turbinata]